MRPGPRGLGWYAAVARHRLGERSTRRGILVAMYVTLILFLLAVSLAFDPIRGAWRLGPIETETIVLALLLFLPGILPRVSSLSLPFFSGQASIEFLQERIEIQEERVALLSNETDLLLNSLAANLLAPKRSERRTTLVIGCQRGLEQKLLGGLLKTLFETKLDLPADRVEARYENGGGALNYVSLYRRKLDVCPAYTWQGFEMSLGPSLQLSAKELRTLSLDATLAALNDLYRESGIRWLASLRFASNWELVMMRRRADALGIGSIDDLPRRSSRLALGCPREFFARDAAYGSLERAGIRFKKVEFLEEASRYDDLTEGHVDLVVGFSTDPMLESPLFRRLAYSTHEWFGNYHAVPIVTEDALAAFPGLADAVGELAVVLGEGNAAGAAERQIRELIRRAEGAGGSDDIVEAVAQRFLRDKGLS